MQQQQYDPLPRNNDEAAVSSGLMVLRAVTGLVFFMHGWDKLFDDGIGATQQGFDAMGVSLPDITAVIATFLELAGGAMLIAGVLTRIVGILLVIEMIAAMLIVHIEHGFFVTNNGIELVLLLGGASLAIVIAGPGSYSVDAFLGIPGFTNRDRTASDLDQPADRQ